MKIKNKKEAEADGYRSMTKPYELPKEQWMLDNVIADMNRGDIDYMLVEISDKEKILGVEVWRPRKAFRS